MKMQKQYVIGILVFLFVAASAFVIWFSMSETNKPQEIRGQAYGGDNGGGGTCTENQVNVQFRMFEQGTDKPWYDGKDVKPQIGQYIDVNCFAKTGTALLQNPVMTATITSSNGTVENVTLPNPNSAEVRKFQITKAGVYTFACRNTSNTCSDSDKVTVISTTPSPSPSVSPSPTVSPTPGVSPSPVVNSGIVSDLNRDGKVDIQDYVIFFNDYQKNSGL